MMRSGDCRTDGRPSPLPKTEPVTVLPGRYDAIQEDIKLILDLFQEQVGTSPGSFAGCALPPGGSLPTSPRSVAGCALLRVGAFPIFRALYKQLAFSMVIDAVPGEKPRDVFEFTCGECWTNMLNSSDVVRRVGIVFLVYLLFHSQHPVCHAVPVNMPVLGELAKLQRECTRRQVLLECPKILQTMANANIFSVGLRATFRNLQFDRSGLMAARARGSGTHEWLKEARALDSDAAGVEAERIGFRNADGEAALVTHTGEEVVNLTGVLQDIEAYSAQIEEQGQQFDEHGPRVAARLMKTAVESFKRGTPPSPKDFKMAEGLQVVQDDEEPPTNKRKRRRKLRIFPSDSDSADSLLERVTKKIGRPPPRTSVDAEAAEKEQANGFQGARPHCCPVRPRKKRSRQPAQVGLDQYLARRAPPMADEGQGRAEHAKDKEAGKDAVSRGSPIDFGNQHVRPCTLSEADHAASSKPVSGADGDAEDAAGEGSLTDVPAEPDDIFDEFAAQLFREDAVGEECFTDDQAVALRDLFEQAERTEHSNSKTIVGQPSADSETDVGMKTVAPGSDFHADRSLETSVASSKLVSGADGDAHGENAQLGFSAVEKLLEGGDSEANKMVDESDRMPVKPGWDANATSDRALVCDVAEPDNLLGHEDAAGEGSLTDVPAEPDDIFDEFAAQFFREDAAGEECFTDDQTAALRDLFEQAERTEHSNSKTIVGQPSADSETDDGMKTVAPGSDFHADRSLETSVPAEPDSDTDMSVGSDASINDSQSIGTDHSFELLESPQAMDTDSD